MVDRDRTKDGKFKQEVSDAEILEQIEPEGTPTSEVEKGVDLNRDNCHKRLRTLEDRGRVRKRDVGGAYLWFRTDSD